MFRKLEDLIGRNPQEALEEVIRELENEGYTELKSTQRNLWTFANPSTRKVIDLALAVSENTVTAITINIHSTVTLRDFFSEDFKELLQDEIETTFQEISNLEDLAREIEEVLLRYFDDIESLETGVRPNTVKAIVVKKGFKFRINYLQSHELLLYLI